MASSIRHLLFLLTLDLYYHSTIAQDLVLKYSIREEQMPDTYVGNVKRDSLLYGNLTTTELNNLRFQILAQGNQDASYFKINSTSSSIHTKTVLNREVLCTDPDQSKCELKFNVAVYKQIGDSIDLFKIIPVEIYINDTNDNSPFFPHDEIAISISEGVTPGFVYQTTGASDADSGTNNSIQSYQILPANEMFGLSQISNIFNGMEIGIVVRFQLDRETRDFYQVTIKASDRGFPSRTGSVLVNITITDENDNKPLFKLANYTATIPENKPVGSTILLLSASDHDAGENARMTFSFTSNTEKKVLDHFGINATSGQVFVKSELDYEIDPDYQFVVVVNDHGTPSLSSTAIVKVIIQDLNDNAPQINVNLPLGGTDILESSEEGRYVANVFVSDLDSGLNGQVQCKVLGNKFRLEVINANLNMYKIVIKNKLDYETEKFHNVTVDCHDLGTPQKQNLTSFFIRVQDVNDNAPEFTKNIYEASIYEERAPGEFVVEVMATDKDSGDNSKIVYSLHSDAGRNFTIDRTMGTIMSNNTFDREAKAIIRFHVIATDRGDSRLSSSSLIVVTLRDINDNAPQFTEQVFNFIALENQERNPKIGVLTAKDKDAGINGQFSFSFVHPKPVDFSIDSENGTVRGITRLDRELQTDYNFTVMVMDMGSPRLSSRAKVFVTVIDDNDNIPIISHPNNHNNTVYLPYTSSVGTLVTQVEAYDNDVGENSQLLYYIDKIDPSKSRDLFNMDVYTGKLVIAKEMHLYDADTYNLVLAVKDRGVSQTTSYTNLNVVITVSNTTVLPQPSVDDRGMNMIIVVVIVIVTAVLSVAIVVTIIVIRRIDHGPPSKELPKNEEKTIITARRNESMSTDVSLTSDDPLKQRSKKEVSFSLSDENDSMNNSTLTNITTFSTFKNPPGMSGLSGLSSIDHKSSMEIPQASSSLLAGNISDISRDSLLEKKYELHRYYQQQNQHIRPQSPETIWLQQLKQEEANRIRDLLKKGDDAASEMSAESATSDSGRGGSEEDVHSNRGHPLSDTEEPRLMFPGDNHSSRQGRGDNHGPHQGRGDNHGPRQGRHTNSLHSKYKDRPERSDIYHRNISFSDDSVTANTTVDGSRLLSKNHSLTPIKANLSTFSNSSYSGNSSIPYKSSNNSSMFSSYGGKSKLDTVNESGQSGYGLKYSLADIDDTISESVITRDGDGDSTTTSGSYTINPDELCHEIDNLFFNDVIV